MMVAPERPRRPHFKTRQAADAHAVKNRKLVFSQANCFVNLGILTRDELISEGDLANLRAARKWPGLGQYSTYAVTAIRRAMLKAIKRRTFYGQEPPDDEDGAYLDTLPLPRPRLKGPIDLSELTPVEARVIAKYYGLGGRSMTAAEIGAELGMDAAAIERIRETALKSLRAIEFDE